jgi:hypothetical protein
VKKHMLAHAGTTLVVALTLAAPAGARTVAGAQLDVAPNAALGASTPSVFGVNTVAPSGATLPINTPAAGVLTEIRVRHGATTSTPSILGLRLASGAAPNFTLQRLTSVADGPWPANQPAGILTFRPVDEYGRQAGVPIGVGESVAVLRIGTSGIEPNYIAQNNGTLTFGTSRPSEGTVTSSGTAAASALVQWIVEPDADADGYGDETQDTCIGTAGPCLPVATGPEQIVTTIQTVTVDRPVPAPAPAPVVQTVTVTKTVPSAACVAARKASATATTAVKKAETALKKRKTSTNRKKLAAAKKTLAKRKAEVKLQC